MSTRAMLLLGLGQILLAASPMATAEAPPPDCAQHPAELRLNAPRLDGKRAPKPLAFARNAQCLQRLDGRTEPVVLFSIDLPAPLEINASVENRQNRILAARIEVLDADFERIATYPFDAFTRRGGHYSLSVFSNDPERPIRYLLVGIDADAVGRSDQRLMSGYAFIPLPGGGYNHSYESALRSEMSDTGWIGITLKPLQDEP